MQTKMRHLAIDDVQCTTRIIVIDRKTEKHLRKTQTVSWRACGAKVDRLTSTVFVSKKKCAISVPISVPLQDSIRLTDRRLNSTALCKESHLSLKKVHHIRCDGDVMRDLSRWKLHELRCFSMLLGVKTSVVWSSR